MKFSILDVPESLSNFSQTKEGEGARQHVPNPVPDMVPSIHMNPADAHQLVKNLAIEDGWTALYDPTNEDSLIFDGDDVVGIRDSLGNYPDLYNSEGHGGVTDAEVKPFGATKFYSGLVSSEWPNPPPSFTVLSAAMVAEADPNELAAALVFSGGNPLGDGDYYRCFAQNTPSFGAQMVESSGDQGARATNWAAQENGQIITYLTSSGEVYSGYRKLVPDEIDTTEEVDPITHLSMGDPWAAFREEAGPNGFGPTLFTTGDVDPEAHQRMVALLSRLSGATVGLPPGEADEPLYYVTLDEDGNRTFGHMPHKPDLLASVVKVLTCFIARRDFVPDSKLDEIETLEGPYVSSNSPSVQSGDQISWRDMFYASMHRSHNYITQNIARLCGLMISPNATNPTQEFLNYVQAEIDSWGWSGAEYINSQGHGSDATPQQIAELMLMVQQEDPWLFGVMGGGLEHTYAIYYGGGSVGTDVTLSKIDTPYEFGTLYFPEFKAGKGGSLAVTKTLVHTWYNPVTRKDNVTVIFRSPDNTSQGRYRSQRAIINASREVQPGPYGYSSEAGSDLSWGRQGNYNYVIGTNHYNAVGEPIFINPLSPDTVSRPVVRAGDKISVSVDVRGINSSVAHVNLRIVGGALEGSDEYSVKRTMNGNWTTISFLQDVKYGGYLDFNVSLTDGGINPWLNLREARVTVSSSDIAVYEYSMDVETFSVSESSQSHDSNDSSGSVGEFDVQVKRPFMDSIFSEYGHGYVRNKRVRLDTWYGSLFGTANGISQANDYSMTISGVSEMGPLNAYNITAPPYTGTLVGLLEVYFSLISNAAPEFSVHPDLLGRTITAPGWKGELWYHLKLLCAAERIQIALRPGGGVRVTPSVHHELEHVPLSDLGVTFQETGLAEAVEVYHYGSQWVNNGLIYPSGGWHEEVEILSVNAGEIAEQTLELSASLESFVTPQMAEHVGKEEEDKSVYTIVGDDGFPIKPGQWTDNGGKVEFELGEDTRTIHVTMTGASGIRNDQGELMRSFSLALASDTSGSRYSTLRILGTGVVFDRREVRFPTGVPSELTGTEIGATIDNPFISTMGQAAQAGALAAYKFAGAAPELSQTSLGPHLGQWGTDVLSGMITSDIANYRVREVTYTPEGASLTGDYYLTYDHFKFNGTYDEFNTANDGLTYDDVQARGNKYE